MNDWIENNGVRPDVGASNYEVRLRDGEVLHSEDEYSQYYAFVWVLDNNLRDIVEWRFTDTPILLKPKEIKPMKENLNQSEVQQLLHILRGQLDIVSFYKEMNKEDAAALWAECDKSDKFTSGTFAAFSATLAAYKQHKGEEKKLVNLVTKLKGLR